MRVQDCVLTVITVPASHDDQEQGNVVGQFCTGHSEVLSAYRYGH